MIKKKKRIERSHNAYIRRYYQDSKGDWIEDKSKRENVRYNPKTKEYEPISEDESHGSGV